jgi:hypothetical protein
MHPSRYAALSLFPLPLGKGFRAPHFNCLVKITFSLQGQTKFWHVECVMLRKHSNRELVKQHFNYHSEPFIICFLAVFLMFFGSNPDYQCPNPMQ